MSYNYCVYGRYDADRVRERTANSLYFQVDLKSVRAKQIIECAHTELKDYSDLTDDGLGFNLLYSVSAGLTI